MPFATLPLEYLGWHYTLALADFWRNAKNLLGFLARFFSLKILLKTFFSPWKRMGESYQKGFNPGAWFETFILNTLMRVLGVLLRFWLVLAGLVALVAAGLLTLVAFLLWLALPLAVVVLFLSGLDLLIK